MLSRRKPDVYMSYVTLCGVPKPDVVGVGGSVGVKPLVYRQ